MSFTSLALTLKKGSYKLHIWLVEMGSQPPWTQTFSESWLEDQGLKTNTHIEILSIFASFSSQSQRFPGGNFAAGNQKCSGSARLARLPHHSKNSSITGSLLSCASSPSLLQRVRGSERSGSTWLRAIPLRRSSTQHSLVNTCQLAFSIQGLMILNCTLSSSMDAGEGGGTLQSAQLQI